MINKAKNIILINGTSCAGKSSVSKYLCEHLDEEFEHIAWDDYVERIQQYEALREDQKSDLLSMFLRDTSDKLKAGEKLILDVVCVSTQTLKDLIEFYEPYGLLTVYMKAPLDVLNDRENQRPNRAKGQAEEQFYQIRDEENHPPYDMDFDSSQLTTEEIGANITQHVSDLNTPLNHKPTAKQFKP